MKTLRRAVCGVSILALLTTVTVLAGPAQAAHLECGDVITASTTLDSDVGPCTGDGIVIATDGITLNLNRHRVFAANGPGDNAGIRLDGVSGVTVINGIVDGFDAGVFIDGGSGNTVRRVGAMNNINDGLGAPCDLGDGIALRDSSNNTVDRNLVVNNGPYGGITLIGDSDNNVVTSNQVRDNNIVGTPGSGCGNANQDEGIRIEGPGAQDNRVESNEVSNSLLAGIALHGHVCNPLNPSVPPEPANTGNVIVRNSVTGTAGTSVAAGINILQQGPATVVCPAFQNTIERNRTNNNDGDGIFVAANSHDNQINHNQANDNDNDGVHLNGPRVSNVFTNVGPTLLDLVAPDRPPFVEGTDYRVMPGSGSGDVTGELVAIDISVPADPLPTNTNPVDTSTSGCEQADYDAAGFQAGDVALIQRGTCTFVAKVDLAIANGASAVVMFNEGQAGRTTFAFGAVAPVPIPVVSTTYAVGVELFELTQAGEVIIHVITNTTNVQEVAAPGAFDNVLTGNRANGNADFDGFDGNLDPPCDNNRWVQNQFGTVNQPCVGSTTASAAAAAGAASSESTGGQERGGEFSSRGQDLGSATAGPEVS
jgi:parallel beta-helix repeat protein